MQAFATQIFFHVCMHMVWLDILMKRKIETKIYMITVYDRYIDR